MNDKASTSIDSDRHEIRCACGHQIYLNGVIKSRVVNALEGWALCRCKERVGIPISVKEPNIDLAAS